MIVRMLGIAAVLAVSMPLGALAQTADTMASPMPGAGMTQQHHKHHRHHRRHHACRDPKTGAFESCKTPGAVRVTPRSSSRNAMSSPTP
ncbi:MAG: hypothetical protein M3N13_10865 [Candidatus Eremiobacteraeota bacterium]|nr:hypothetical protein [Candidatus Eremiobacteraeota bacterium]